MSRSEKYDTFRFLLWYTCVTSAFSYGAHYQGFSQDNRSLFRTDSEDPDFIAPIGNITSPVGREVILSCSVENLGNYKVGWLRADDQTILSLHTRVVTHNSRISVTHDNHRTWQLHIRQVKETDRGCYMCQINTNVMKKQLGCIDVHVPPDIINDDSSTDLSVQEGENATLVCQATGHPSPRVTWRREDGESIIVRRGHRDVVKVDTFSGSALQFWKVDRKQMGVLLCIASNDVPPAVSKRITLSVNFAPIIKVPNQLLGAPLGTDVQLECHVEAYPNTINYWVKNRGEMLLDGLKYSVHENRSSYRTFMWLTIKRFSSTDIGTYNCVSTNSLGRAEGTLRLYGLADVIKGQSLSNGNSSASSTSRQLLLQIHLVSMVYVFFFYCCAFQVS